MVLYRQQGPVLPCLFCCSEKALLAQSRLQTRLLKQKLTLATTLIGRPRDLLERPGIRHRQECGEVRIGGDMMPLEIAGDLVHGARHTTNRITSYKSTIYEYMLNLSNKNC